MAAAGADRRQLTVSGHSYAAPDGDVHLCPAKKVLRGGPGEAAHQVHPRHVPSERRAGGVHPRAGGAQQATQERGGKAAGQARELPGAAAQVPAAPLRSSAQGLGS